ncbi:FAD dependent oxidoreductase [Sporobacter termitidis DSM 10068]|uniref:FAD dependent oxidoreductase n=1 Tax=Sporobacter termitidis DSM 10068 TaxID=1123282 RepID=A0A1M5XT87_9FIRM|nr:FAD-dependent oxidoreductase [Sporobacter termitidis]SHI03045.1 FAD dependent oxidoreductase [Sporobacter termitidis DSM 10068]
MKTIHVNRATKIVKKGEAPPYQQVKADICVVGAGIAGVSAAIEAARLGHKVVLLDGLPNLGGNAANGAMGLFCGFFSHGVVPFQLTYGVASEILRDLGAAGRLYLKPPIAVYDEVALLRWIENKVREAGITVILNSYIHRVNVSGRRITSIEFTSRYGSVVVEADGFIDASGDAAVAWNAGLPCRESDVGMLYGSQLMYLTNVHIHRGDDQAKLEAETSKCLEEKAPQYGLMRKSGFLSFPVVMEEGVAFVNMTHIETPLDPLGASTKIMEGKDQADRVVELLKNEFPKEFGDAVVQKYGLLGIRQTRWIMGSRQLTVDDICAGTRFPDAVARSSWPIELHDHPGGYVWEVFPGDHVHYIPYGSMTPPDMDNLLAVGRCIDGDVAALSSVRVMGPCIATGKAAANALDIAGKGSVHDISIEELENRLSDNLNRADHIDQAAKP